MCWPWSTSSLGTLPAGTVPKDYPRHFDGLSGRPRASVSRRSPRSRAHRGHRAGFVEVGSGGDQGQHIEVSAGHEPEDVAPVSSSPRTSDPQPVTPDGTISNRVSSSPRASVGRDTARGYIPAYGVVDDPPPRGLAITRDARRSHRSVEGDEKPHKMRERQRQTATKPRYYIRGIEITAQTGLGRIGAGGGLARDFEHHHHVVHLGLGRASWHGTQGLPPPFRRPLLTVLSRRFRADPHEVGRIEGIGLDS